MFEVLSEKWPEILDFFISPFLVTNIIYGVLFDFSKIAADTISLSAYAIHCFTPTSNSLSLEW